MALAVLLTATKLIIDSNDSIINDTLKISQFF